ncbi:Os11g0697600 [Oryza sativa Japonica Group]|uniref:Os11g0697600 protein n=1 Tax=Oryza sativa subsp. japonica TaxID=39947 RepID=A0A0P0Y5K3_ORYSJ|nr:Os11g0697600 [Oryza sativa Japonica Group]
MFDIVDFFKHVCSFYSKTFVICVKLYVYIKVYLTINQMIEKKINNYLNFLNKTNDQTFLKKVNGVKHFRMKVVLKSPQWYAQ